MVALFSLWDGRPVYEFLSVCMLKASGSVEAN